MFSTAIAKKLSTLFNVFSILAILSQLTLGALHLYIGTYSPPSNLRTILTLLLFATAITGLVFTGIIVLWQPELAVHQPLIAVMGCVSLGLGLVLTLLFIPLFLAVFLDMAWGCVYGPSAILSPVPGILLIMTGLAAKNK